MNSCVLVRRPIFLIGFKKDCDQFADEIISFHGKFEVSSRLDRIEFELFEDDSETILKSV